MMPLIYEIAKAVLFIIIATILSAIFWRITFSSIIIIAMALYLITNLLSLLISKAINIMEMLSKR